MNFITWTHPGIAYILEAIPVDTRTLLDVGCGGGVIGALCRIYRRCERQVGVDAYAPGLELCRRHSFYDELVRLDLMTGTLPFDDASFDVVTCIEVIEHLPRPEGLRLLDELERVGRHVIVTTPNGFLEQDALEENPLQRHLSGWTVADFRKRGYAVQGIGGMRILGGHRKYLSAALGPLSRYVPSMSELLLSQKRQHRPA
jgi:2-polyprenyl-3-methyl-5-hydroxy-6-metoxy-1,4-benzoquinol methylase